MADRTLVVKILGDDKSLRNAFSRSSKDSKRWGDSLNKAARGGAVATVGFRGLGRSVAFASGAFLGGAGFVAAAKGAVNAASNLSEQLNKTNVVFGKSSTGVKAFASTAAASLGLSQRAALEAAGGFGAMLETAGLTSAEAAKFSKNLVRLGADMASFNNIDPSEALLKLKSGLAGEAEPLRTVGVLLSETRVKQEAYRLGLAKVGETLTEGQKVQARYALILKDTAKQQGDFGRTSEGLANQQRILGAQVENLQAQIGKALLPDILKVVKALNTWLSSSENQERVQREINSAVKTAEGVFGAFLDVARPLAKVAQETATALGGTKNAVKLLIAVMVAAKVSAFANSLGGVGTQAAIASTRVTAFGRTVTTAGATIGATTGKVNALRGALLRLGAIGLITLGIEVLLNRKQISEGTKDFLKSHGLGGLAGGATLEIPATVKIADLEATRNRIAALKGESDLMVKALDGVIAKLREVDKQRLSKAQASFVGLRKKINAIPDKKQVDVLTTLKGIENVQSKLAKVKDKSVQLKVIEAGLADITTRLSNVRGKTVSIEFIAEGIADIQRQLDALSVPKFFDLLIGSVQDLGGKVDEAAPKSVRAVFDNIIGATVTGNKKLQAAFRTSKTLSKKAFRDFMDSLARDATAAGATLSDADDLGVLLQQLGAVQGQIQVQGRTKALLDQQANLMAQIVSTRRDIKTKADDEAAGLRDLALARAQTTKSLVDDIAVLRDQQAAVKAQIKVEGATAALLTQQFQIGQDIIAAQRQQDANQAARRQRRQFKGLGLTAEGQERAPSKEALKNRLGTLRTQIAGTVLDTPKTQAQLDRIGKVLSKKFGKLGRDVRAAILAMFADISGALKDKKGPLTKTSSLNSKKLLEGLGLSPEQIRELRGRLSNFNSAGVGLGGSQTRSTGGGRFIDRESGGPIVVQSNVTVTLDGQKVGSSVTKHQQKDRRRNPKQKRGPHRMTGGV